MGRNIKVFGFVFLIVLFANCKRNIDSGKVYRNGEVVGEFNLEGNQLNYKLQEDDIEIYHYYKGFKKSSIEYCKYKSCAKIQYLYDKNDSISGFEYFSFEQVEPSSIYKVSKKVSSFQAFDIQIIYPQNFEHVQKDSSVVFQFLIPNPEKASREVCVSCIYGDNVYFVSDSSNSYYFKISLPSEISDSYKCGVGVNYFDQSNDTFFSYQKGFDYRVE